MKIIAAIFLANLLQPCNECLTFFGRNNTLLRQHPSMCLRAGQIVLNQFNIKSDTGIKLDDRGMECSLKALTPGGGGLGRRGLHSESRRLRGQQRIIPKHAIDRQVTRGNRSPDALKRSKKGARSAPFNRNS